MLSFLFEKIKNRHGRNKENYYKTVLLFPKDMYQISMITKSVYVSAGKAITDMKIRQYGISLIINATASLPLYKADSIDLRTSLHVVRIPLCDTNEEVIFPYFEPAADLIRANEELGGTTLVHCHWGKSRSVSLCIAYLMIYQTSKIYYGKHMTPKEALECIRKTRYFAMPNKNFLIQLEEFWNHLENAKFKIHSPYANMSVHDAIETNRKWMRRTAKMVRNTECKKVEHKQQKVKKAIQRVQEVTLYLKTLNPVSKNCQNLCCCPVCKIRMKSLFLSKNYENQMSKQKVSIHSDDGESETTFDLA